MKMVSNKSQTKTKYSLINGINLAGIHTQSTSWNQKNNFFATLYTTTYEFENNDVNNIFYTKEDINIRRDGMITVLTYGEVPEAKWLIEGK